MYAEHTHQELVHTLSECIRSISSLRVCSVHAWVFPFFKCPAKGIDAHSEHVFNKLMHALCIRIRNSYLHWAYASRTNKCAEHMNQELVRALSILGIRNLCVLWGYYASGTYACTEHTVHQELMRALSILCIRNSCLHWAYYASGTYACTEHTHQELMPALSIHIGYFCMHWAYAQRTYMVAEHTHQFLTRMLSISVKIPNLKRSLLDMLSIRVRNSCVHLAYASGTYGYDQRAHKNLTDA